MKTITNDDLLQYMAEQESYFLVRPGDIRDQILAELEHGDQLSGDLMPWRKTQTHFGFRPNEVTVWAGINGHGKSAVMGQVMAEFCKTRRVVIASLEMPLHKTMARMVKQMAGTSQPSEGFTKSMLEWFDQDRLWLYDVLDSVESERIVALCHYARKELNADHLVIDSLVKCGLSGVDGKLIAQQKEFVDHLCRIARSTGIHIHLVHHMRKGDDEGRIPSKFDVKGAGEIADLVDNIIIVHRNVRKEEKIRTGQEVFEEEHDTALRVAKQRHFSWEGTFNLWFDPASGQYMAGPNERPSGWMLDRTTGAVQ